MATPRELEEKFWSALRADRTMMLGLDGVEDGHARPMTAQLYGDKGPIWFFTARDNALVKKLAPGNRAIATFAAKNHDLFATLHGSLSIDNGFGIQIEKQVVGARAHGQIGEGGPPLKVKTQNGSIRISK